MISHTFHKSVPSAAEGEWIWELKETPPFDEAIVSWNGTRPAKGAWTISVSLFQKEWSPWLPYAAWSPTGQRTFQSETSFAKTYQDAAQPKEGGCTGIRIRIEGDLKGLKSLSACLSHLAGYRQADVPPLPAVWLRNMPLQSQMILDHPRHRDLCSPTSTANAINFLLGERAVDPVRFAEKSRDEQFDIFGNWILNTAEAYEQLKGAYQVHVERLSGFAALHQLLSKGTPVVVSVKGALKGAPQEYKWGHLICVRGWDPETRRVHCVDSAFLTNEATEASYDLDDFLRGWSLRKNIAYVFTKTC